MSDLPIYTVDENDRVVGSASMREAHKHGLRHRAVEIFLFKYPDQNDLLLSLRCDKQRVDAGKVQPSAAGHVTVGQTYRAAALEEMKDELFYGFRELPSGLRVAEIARFKLDQAGKSEETNLENVRLYYAVYSGRLSYNPKEIDAKSRGFVPIKEVIADLSTHPNSYTATFEKSMAEYAAWRATKTYLNPL